MTEAKKTRSFYKRGPRIDTAMFNLVKDTKNRFPNMNCEDIAGYVMGKGFTTNISRATVARILQMDSFEAYENYRSREKAKRTGDRSFSIDCDDGDPYGEMAAEKGQEKAEIEQIMARAIVIITDVLTDVAKVINAHEELLRQLMKVLGVDPEEEK